MNDKVTLFGEVIDAGGGRIEVRLDGDEVGVLRDGVEPLPVVGHRGEFVVEGRAADGRAIVAPARPSGNAAEAAAFDLEFDRLQSALAGRPTAPRAQLPRTASRSIHEEQIRDWVRRVDSTLSQLRKHRAKRLSENDEA